MTEPSDFQMAVLDGLLRAEESGVPYPWRSVPRPTRAALVRHGWVRKPVVLDGTILSGPGRGLAVGWRKGSRERRKACA